MYKNNTKGIYYELPNGKIAYTYGFTKDSIQYYFDNDESVYAVTKKEFQTWKPRKDLKDFPNASDPRLPYEFDLNWDIKFMSQLKLTLENDDFDSDILETMKKYNITIPE